jgi:23S rRNA (cytosine1962-C5)-methyltransferase
MADFPSSISQININARAAARLRAGHVWVYDSDVVNRNQAKPGALVHVVDPKGKPLGTALYSSSSQIVVRLLARELIATEEELGRFTRKRLEEAIAHRAKVVLDSDAYRVVFSEADRLPGLIIDRYNDVYTLQALTQAWDAPERKLALVQSLKELTHAHNIVERVDERIRELEQLEPMQPKLLEGTKSDTIVTMNGVHFHYDALAGQKTGAFLDQRENYEAATAYARGEVLDVCTYHGGFALHLARTCDRVTAIDISREALEVAEQNEKLNASANKNEVEWMEANAFDLMKDYAAAGRQYDAIVLDPPAFAKSKRQLEGAIRGYKELNLRALKMLRPGGILVTCSCSFHVSESDFIEVITSAAQDAHRSVQVLEKRTQSKDHPILLGVPETYYLKCLICSVR